MDDHRRDIRVNGNVSRNPSLSGPSGVSHLRQTNVDVDGPELTQFQLTKTLGEAMYTYSKMRDAEQEKKSAEGDYQRQSQYFENNVKLKEAMESRRIRTERNFMVARSDYTKAAREAEPLLRELTSGAPENQSPAVKEDMVLDVVEKEIRDRKLVNFRMLDSELDKSERKMDAKWSQDLRTAITRETKNFALRTDHDRLAEQIRALNVRGRQGSAASESPREVDHRIVAHSRELDQIRLELASTQQQYASDMSALAKQLQTLAAQFGNQHSPRVRMNSGAKPEDLIKVEAALEKAQEVINDQYVTIHDVQLQLSSVLEGIRVLNERIEEYDHRLEGVQESTQKFFTEAQAENNRRSTVICQAFDTLHDKVISEISTKLEHPVSPASAPYNSPHLESPRIPLPLTFPPNAGLNLNQLTTHIGQMKAQLENQAKLINDLHVRINNHQQQFAAAQRINSDLPSRVSQFCDEVSSHLQSYQRDQVLLSERFKNLEFTVGGISQTLAKHTQNTDNNFRETAMHMDSVKKRFAEHRKQLDNLITAWRETMTTTDQLNGKFESLKDFLSTKVVPTIAKIHQSLPNLMEGVQPPNRSTASPRNNTSSNPTTTTAQQPGSSDRRASVSGGGARDPIEL